MDEIGGKAVKEEGRGKDKGKCVDEDGLDGATKEQWPKEGFGNEEAMNRSLFLLQSVSHRMKNEFTLCSGFFVALLSAYPQI